MSKRPGEIFGLVNCSFLSRLGRLQLLLPPGLPHTLCTTGLNSRDAFPIQGIIPLQAAAPLWRTHEDSTTIRQQHQYLHLFGLE
jgi:hypothetical protein